MIEGILGKLELKGEDLAITLPETMKEGEETVSDAVEDVP